MSPHSEKRSPGSGLIATASSHERCGAASAPSCRGARSIASSNGSSSAATSVADTSFAVFRAHSSPFPRQSSLYEPMRRATTRPWSSPRRIPPTCSRFQSPATRRAIHSCARAARARCSWPSVAASFSSPNDGAHEWPYALKSARRMSHERPRRWSDTSRADYGAISSSRRSTDSRRRRVPTRRRSRRRGSDAGERT